MVTYLFLKGILNYIFKTSQKKYTYNRLTCIDSPSIHHSIYDLYHEWRLESIRQPEKPLQQIASAPKRNSGSERGSVRLTPLSLFFFFAKTAAPTNGVSGGSPFCAGVPGYLDGYSNPFHDFLQQPRLPGYSEQLICFRASRFLSYFWTKNKVHLYSNAHLEG